MSLAGEAIAPHEWFAGRDAVLATRHGKEQQIGPVLEPVLGTRLRVLPDFDSDRFGTFDGSRPRPGSQLDAARAKARAAAAEAGCDLVVASEGRFGPHPLAPWCAHNVEALLLLDLARDREIVAVAQSSDTNFGEKTVADLDQGLACATAWGFPGHGLILSRPDGSVIAKGVQEADLLHRTLAAALAEGPVRLQTDMRAMVNPRRQAVIAAAAAALVTALQAACPACRWPGFTASERQPGLPCRDCGYPTSRARAARAVCGACGHEAVEIHPDGDTRADPRYCNLCNP
jgi:hypothetical protein